MRSRSHGFECKKTWTAPIKLSDLKEGDLIYVRRNKNGYMIGLECKFLKYERGLVHVEIINIPNPIWYKTDFPIGNVIKVRSSMTYLWGAEEGKLFHCHWCKKGVFT